MENARPIPGKLLRRHGIVLLISGIACLHCGGGGGGDGNGVAPSDQTPEALTQNGWSQFEKGKTEDALADFLTAISKDPEYGPAYVGCGWCQFTRSTSGPSLEQALATLNTAYAKGQTGCDVRSARASIQLALGGGYLASSIAEVQAARALNGDFVFAHRQTFTIDDLYLIESFAEAARADFVKALALADSVMQSGISSRSPGTWIVDGVSFSSFHGAVLAFLHKLSSQEAG